jgi:hypothetical protein
MEALQEAQVDQARRQTDAVERHYREQRAAEFAAEYAAEQALQRERRLVQRQSLVGKMNVEFATLGANILTPIADEDSTIRMSLPPSFPQNQLEDVTARLRQQFASEAHSANVSSFQIYLYDPEAQSGDGNRPVRIIGTNPIRVDFVARTATEVSGAGGKVLELGRELVLLFPGAPDKAVEARASVLRANFEKLKNTPAGSAAAEAGFHKLVVSNGAMSVTLTPTSGLGCLYPLFAPFLVLEKLLSGLTGSRNTTRTETPPGTASQKKARGNPAEGGRPSVEPSENSETPKQTIEAALSTVAIGQVTPLIIKCPKCSKAYKLRAPAKPTSKFRCKQCDFAAPFELLKYADVRPASELFNTLGIESEGAAAGSAGPLETVPEKFEAEVPDEETASKPLKVERLTTSSSQGPRRRVPDASAPTRPNKLILVALTLGIASVLGIATCTRKQGDPEDLTNAKGAEPASPSPRSPASPTPTPGPVVHPGRERPQRQDDPGSGTPQPAGPGTPDNARKPSSTVQDSPDSHSTPSTSPTALATDRGGRLAKLIEDGRAQLDRGNLEKARQAVVAAQGIDPTSPAVESLVSRIARAPFPNTGQSLLLPNFTFHRMESTLTYAEGRVLTIGNQWQGQGAGKWPYAQLEFDAFQRSWKSIDLPEQGKLTTALSIGDVAGVGSGNGPVFADTAALLIKDKPFDLNNSGNLYLGGGVWFCLGNGIAGIWKLDLHTHLLKRIKDFSGLRASPPPWHDDVEYGRMPPCVGRAGASCHHFLAYSSNHSDKSEVKCILFDVQGAAQKIVKYAVERPKTTRGLDTTPIALCDLDHDGSDEILCVSGDHIVALKITGSSLKLVWQSPPVDDTVQDLPAGALFVTDLNGDSQPEVVLLYMRADGRFATFVCSLPCGKR